MERHLSDVLVNTLNFSNVARHSALGSRMDSGLIGKLLGNVFHNS